MKQRINEILKGHLQVCQKVQKNNLPVVEKIVKVILASYRNGGRVFFMGNGGSAADAQHLATELVCRLKLERKALPALALNTNNSLTTAQGNDYGFDTVFSRQIEAWVKQGDVVIGISTSGHSANVIKAITLANEKGATTICFAGNGGGELAKVAKINLTIPSSVTQHIQEMHITLGHIICELVEEGIAKK